MHNWRVGVGAWFALAAGVISASAQEPVPRPVGLVYGGEITGALSRPDHAAFFNYTSYEQDTLRLARVRLFAEVRLPGRLDVVAEARTENETVGLPTAFGRWQPWARAALFVQAGRIPPVIGAFARRAYGADNFVVGIPLAYQYLTSLRPDALPASEDDVFRMRGRGWLPSFPIGDQTARAGLPMIALKSADAGVAVHGQVRSWTASVALTQGVPADPRLRDNNGGRAWSGRLATARPGGLVVGVSAAIGPWIDRARSGVDDSGASQTLVGMDAEFARGHWVVRGEWWRSAFEVPTIARTLVAQSGFVEGRYRWHPRWQVATRVDRMAFAPLIGRSATLPWDASVWRVEVAVGYRVTRRLDLRAAWQQNWRDGGRVRARGFPIAQASFWF